MRYFITCMLLCLSSAHAQETGDESPIVTTEEGDEGQVAIDGSYVDWGCGCGKKKGDNGGK